MFERSSGGSAADAVTRRAGAVGAVALVLAGAIVAFAAVTTVRVRRLSRRTRRLHRTCRGPRAAVPDLPASRRCRSRTGSAIGHRVRVHRGDGRRMPEARGDGIVGVGRGRDGRRRTRRHLGSAPRLLVPVRGVRRAGRERRRRVRDRRVDRGRRRIRRVALRGDGSVPPIHRADRASRAQPFQFPWVDVATHATSAGCQTDDVLPPRFEIDWIDKSEHTRSRHPDRRIEIREPLRRRSASASTPRAWTRRRCPARRCADADLRFCCEARARSADATEIPGVPIPVCASRRCPATIDRRRTRRHGASSGARTRVRVRERTGVSPHRVGDETDGGVHV